MQRPVVFLENWHRVDAMLDTGALFPIWVRNEKILKKFGAQVVLDSVKFGGFGGDAYGSLYRLPHFQIGDLIYPNMHIIACELTVPCHMILSASMFSHLRYEVDDVNHFLNITVPDQESHIQNLVIKNENGHLKVLCTSA